MAATPPEAGPTKPGLQNQGHIAKAAYLEQHLINIRPRPPVQGNALLPSSAMDHARTTDQLYVDGRERSRPRRIVGSVLGMATTEVAHPTLAHSAKIWLTSIVPTGYTHPRPT